jgi:porin
MVYRAAPGSDRGLTVFGIAALDPQPNIAIVPFQLSGGAIYKGLVPGRPDDRAIFGVIYGNFSNDYADSVETTLGGLPTEEIDLEWGYRIQASQFAYIQPDVQVVTNPGGSGTIPDAVVLGAQFGLKF